MKRKAHFFKRGGGVVVPAISAIATADTLDMRSVWGLLPADTINVRSLTGSPDGKYLYSNTYGTPESNAQITLTTPNDLSSYSVTISAKQNNTPIGMLMSKDGLKFYQTRLGVYTDQMFLGTAFQLNTQTLKERANAPLNQWTDFSNNHCFTNDGYQFASIQQTAGVSEYYNLSTARDLTTMIESAPQQILGTDSLNTMQFINDTKFISVDNLGELKLCELLTANDLSGGFTELSVFDLGVGINILFTCFATDNLLYLYTLDDTTSVVTKWNLTVTY